jgi:hypothetical protein
MSAPFTFQSPDLSPLTVSDKLSRLLLNFISKVPDLSLLGLNLIAKLAVLPPGSLQLLPQCNQGPAIRVVWRRLCWAVYLELLPSSVDGSLLEYRLRISRGEIQV